MILNAILGPPGVSWTFGKPARLRSFSHDTDFTFLFGKSAIA